MNNDYCPIVFDSTATDFPFVAELPKKAKSKLVKFWEAFRAFSDLRKEHGELVPQKVAATLLDISTTRVDELVETGKLVRKDFCGHVYITENSLVEVARSERKAGRPLKKLEECASSPLAAWKVAREHGREYGEELRQEVKNHLEKLSSK